MGCGRGPGGDHVDDLGPCPTASSVELHGINGGENGGRICWAVAGTFCEGSHEGVYASRLVSCLACEFYQQVRREEGPDRLVVQCPKRRASGMRREPD
jgi:hypothetical protein